MTGAGKQRGIATVVVGATLICGAVGSIRQLFPYSGIADSMRSALFWSGGAAIAVVILVLWVKGSDR